jgi:hemoglobin
MMDEFSAYRLEAASSSQKAASKYFNSVYITQYSRFCSIFLLVFFNLRPMNSPSFYDAIGGEATFARIVDRFYDNATNDAVLSPMYPPDLVESKRTLRLFLMQYFGGPGNYSIERGHPRLRMRHVHFSIGQAERDAWMRHMKAAVEAEVPNPEACEVLLKYFEQAATFMMNR